MPNVPLLTCQAGLVGMSSAKPSGVNPTSAGSKRGMYTTPAAAAGVDASAAVAALLSVPCIGSAAASAAAAGPAAVKGAAGSATRGRYCNGCVGSSAVLSRARCCWRCCCCVPAGAQGMLPVAAGALPACRWVLLLLPLVALPCCCSSSEDSAAAPFCCRFHFRYSCSHDQ